MSPQIKQITIAGTGSIGGSLGLALKENGFAGRIVGFDYSAVLEQARACGAIDEGHADLARAVAGSDVVVLALPVGGIIDCIERLGPLLAPGTLLTDVGSSKAQIVSRAKSVFGSAASARFLAGHPMAGKERSGIAEADGALFRGAVWIVTPTSGQRIHDGLIAGYLSLIETIGARVVSMDAERHDYLCGWVSHMPQMLAIALANTMTDEFGGDPELHGVGGRALREMTRVASSPYYWWRDVAATNAENIEAALLALEQHLAHIRENLRGPALRDEFARANKFNLPGPKDQKK